MMQSQPLATTVAITLFHNPACGTSRNVLAMIRNSGVEPDIVEYLKTPPTAAQLRELVDAMGIGVRSLLRQKGAPYDELGLGEATWTDAQLIDFIVQHPILMNRPVVVTPLGTRLCRPSETVLDLLPFPQQSAFVKEEDQAIVDRAGRVSSAPQAMTALVTDLLQVPDATSLWPAARSSHAPRILMLYGSLRERSYSRLLTLEGARLLQALGADVRVFDPHGLPLPDDAPDTHPKVNELRELATWSEGMVWTSPERHGAMTGILKAQVDWIPLSVGAVRPTQGKTLAVMQVSGGSQSFNAVNQLRVLGRWMRMLTIPNQSSVAKAFMEFDEAGRMKPSAYYDRVVDVMEELVKFTLLTRDASPYLVDRYSERKESAEALSDRVNQRVI